ncbi:hypothetical protein UPYG_G00206740 [Umbra pygmaea]|uniref:Uncharacterized protein n=1 Tax=Umbra pygmaea TaxID=75934 RepID=A0ABD0WP05_UMBPY
MAPPPTVQSEMARSFPGFFKTKRKHQNLCHRPSKSAKFWKPFDLSFFLLNGNIDTTPSTTEELQLMQAGLGKRTLSINEDITHAELSSLLEKTYPKMVNVQGGWLLYKARGGNGRRRLTAVPLESEGYTGSVIRSASVGGRNILFIVPLQEQLDLTPLPVDAPEFALMPKATCRQCKMVMPLQMLALHVQGCCGEMSKSDSEEADVELIDLEDPTSSIVTLTSSNKPSETQCPICRGQFPPSDLELHASSCGERPALEPEFDHLSPDPGVAQHNVLQDQISCEEDVLRWVASQVQSKKTFNICVSRDNLVERGLKLWKRQKTGSPVNPLVVSFIGELGVDTGALRKEFLSSE